jgi:hypothetical protein
MANDYPQGVDMAAAIVAGFVLDRREAVPRLIGRHEDFLFVTGLAGTARDIAALTHDGAHIYTMAGAMGGACMIGLGLALAPGIELPGRDSGFEMALLRNPAYRRAGRRSPCCNNIHEGFRRRRSPAIRSSRARRSWSRSRAS